MIACLHKQKHVDAKEFGNRYQDYLTQLEEVVRPELLPFIERLRERNPKDIVKPEHPFSNEDEAVGVLFRLFLPNWA